MNANQNLKTIDQKKHGIIILFMIILLILGILITITVVPNYFLTNIVVNSYIDDANELALHDANAVDSLIESKYESLISISNELDTNTHNSLYNDLVKQNNILNSTYLELVSNDGTYLKSSSSSASVDTNISKYCTNSSDKFMTYESKLNESTNKEYFIIGVKINSIICDNITYNYLIGAFETTIFNPLLEVGCYDNQGYNCIINNDGKFMVNYYSSEENISNFYDTLTNYTFSDGYNLSKIKEKINNNESFLLKYQDFSKVDYLLIVSSIGKTDLNIITIIPIDVFESQSNSLISYVVLMFIIVIAVVCSAVVLFVSKKDKQLSNEKKHREELAVALSMAKEANKAKTSFLNNISHDIRTPMNAIIGYTALAKTHIDNEEQLSSYLAKISQSSNHLLSLINDVLDMSRIESGKVIIEEKEENLAEILHSLKNIIQADINKKQQELFIDTIDIKHEYIYCDKLRLNQILLNLLSNAIKFTKPKGQISVRIKEEVSQKEGYACYQFMIKDTGIGIGKDYIKDIFEPFTRERTSTINNIQGTGLGLAITKNLVDLMNGKIEVESEVNVGTTFTVTIDFKVCENSCSIKLIKRLEGQRCLVVDDDLNICHSVSVMLREIGMLSEWTMYGKEAIAKTKEAMELKEEYSVFIIDLQMPDLNGIDTARQIRKIVGSDVPIIILSAYDFTDVESEAKDAGVTTFISKPIFPSDLRDTLLKACGEIKEEIKENEISLKEEFVGKRLLLVEDNELNQEISKTILEESGFKIETANNGKEAVDIIINSNEDYFDAILMDVQMPVMDGYEATRKIRNLDNKLKANLPIIALTANAFEEDKKASYDSGMDAYVGKPINISLLLATLSKIINEKNN